MEKLFEILDAIVDVILFVVLAFIVLVGICYFTGILEVHHLVAIPGVFEKYQICFMGNEIYHWFVGNVTC